jgi:Uma2 family endonuclease
MPSERSYVVGMSPQLMTAEELLHVPHQHAELVRGVLVVREPPGLQHGRVAVNLCRRLADHADAHGLGRVYVESGFKVAVDPDTVRGPDIAFISQTRLPHPEPRGFPDLAPDLAVEILSPTDRPGEVLGRVGDLLDAGTKLVWVIDPHRRLARVYRPDGTEDTINAEQALDGEAVVRGFSCRLETIL